MLSAGGCRSSSITQLSDYEGDPVQQPLRVYVFDFTTDEARVLLSDEDADPERVARDVAKALSKELVKVFEDFDLPVERRTGPLDVPKNYLAIHGDILRVEDGSAGKRVWIGFGSGESRIASRARLYLRGSQGPREFAEFEIATRSGDEPGILTTLPIGMLWHGISAGVEALQSPLPVEDLDESVGRDVRGSASDWGEVLQAYLTLHGWLDEDPESLDWD